MLSNALAVLAVLVSGAALAASATIWKKLSAAHARIHRLERGALDSERQFTSLGRAASRTEARSRFIGVGAEAACHAQHGEEFFIWEQLGFKPQGIFVEIGAYDGVSLSNSLFFEELGWKGLLIEAHPELAAECRRTRPGAIVVHAALGPVDDGLVSFSMVRGEAGLDTLSFVSSTEQHRKRIKSRHGEIEQVEVPARSLSSVMGEVGLGEVDWMSIDVEGAELEVLKGAGLEVWRPKVILVEDNTDGSDPRVFDYLSSFGYRLGQRIGCNCLYVCQP